MGATSFRYPDTRSCIWDLKLSCVLKFTHKPGAPNSSAQTRDACPWRSHGHTNTQKNHEVNNLLTLYLPGLALLPPGHAASARGLSGGEVIFLGLLSLLFLLFYFSCVHSCGAALGAAAGQILMTRVHFDSYLVPRQLTWGYLWLRPYLWPRLVSAKGLPPPHLLPPFASKCYSVTGRASAGFPQLHARTGCLVTARADERVGCVEVSAGLLLFSVKFSSRWSAPSAARTVSQPGRHFQWSSSATVNSATTEEWTWLRHAPYVWRRVPHSPPIGSHLSHVTQNKTE